MQTPYGAHLIGRPISKEIKHASGIVVTTSSDSGQLAFAEVMAAPTLKNQREPALKEGDIVGYRRAMVAEYPTAHGTRLLLPLDSIVLIDHERAGEYPDAPPEGGDPADVVASS